MNRFLQTHTLRLTPLSPLHMGTDEDYTPTNYVILDGVLHEFDHRALLALTDAQRERLQKATEVASPSQALLGLQNFFFELRETLALQAVHHVPVASGVDKLYQQRIGTAAQRESSGKAVINKLEIERTAYNPIDRQPFLPGSGLKGAMRTAVLNILNHGRPLPGDLSDPQSRDGSGLKRHAASELEKTLLNGKFHKDPFRLLHIKDAHPTDNANAQILFALNRSRKNKETKKNLYQTLECLLPGSHFHGQLNLHTPDFSHENLPELHLDLKNLALACNAFYLPRLKQENAQLQRAGYLDPHWQQAINALLEHISPMLDTHKAFLLRVGRHSGAESVTLEGVRHIKISPPGKRPTRWDSTPTTWWLAAEEKDNASVQHFIPFGWLLVEIDPSSDIEALAPLKERFSAPRQHLARLSAELKLRKITLEEEARQQAEAEERAAAEQARLEQMTAEQRQVEALRTRYQELLRFNRKPEPGGDFAQTRQQLLQDAMGWADASARAEAANLIRKTLTLLPWPAKRKKENSKKLQQLEETP